jgi:trans-aconitate methyltransferase
MDEPKPNPAAQSWDPALYESRHAFVWERGASLIELLAPKRGERILDLGCGTGQLTAAIAAAGASVVGLDSSREMLDKARSSYPQIELVWGDARDFAFATPFDAVFSNAVLHWIKEAEATVRCVRQALKKGGRFVAEFGGRGNVRTIEHALREASRRVGAAREEPLWYFPGVAEYATLLEANGLEVHVALLFDRPTPLAGPDGLKDFVRMFARGVLDAVPADRQPEFLQAVEEAARPALLRADGWIADYRRLRVVAVRMA